MKHKGFPVPGGYMGLMPSGKYQIFDTEGEYEDYIKEEDRDDSKRKVKKTNGKEHKDRLQ